MKNNLDFKFFRSSLVSFVFLICFSLINSAFANESTCICSTQAKDLTSAQASYQEKCEIMRGFSSSSCFKQTVEGESAFVCTNGPVFKPIHISQNFFNDCRMSYEDLCISFSNSDWGWNGKESCAPVQKFHERACLDFDGDGWGWNGKSSCKLPEVDLTALKKNIESKITISRTTSSPSSKLPLIQLAKNKAGSSISFEKKLKRKKEIFSDAMKGVEEESILEEEEEEEEEIDENVSQKEDTNPQIVDDSRKYEFEDVIYEQNFEESILGAYSGSEVKDEWNNPLYSKGFNEGRVYIIDEGGSQNKVMKVTYPKGMYGFSGSASFPMKLPESYEELYLAYDIKFEKDFQFVKGGKLPGFCGGDCNTGGNVPTGYDGWSARGMWREDGILENYLYHAGQSSTWGDDAIWAELAKPGVWHRVEHRVKINTVGQKNGIVEAWLDGQKVLYKDDLEFRKKQDIGIDTFYFSSFFGGGDSSWAPSKDVHISFDNFIISKSSIYSE